MAFTKRVFGAMSGMHSEKGGRWTLPTTTECNGVGRGSLYAHSFHVDYSSVLALFSCHGVHSHSSASRSRTHPYAYECGSDSDSITQQIHDAEGENGECSLCVVGGSGKEEEAIC